MRNVDRRCPTCVHAARAPLDSPSSAVAPYHSASLRLNPSALWTLEIEGGVSGLHADLRDLTVASIAIEGGAADVELDLPKPRGELALHIAGGASKLAVRRSAGVPVEVTIDGGASRLRFDDQATSAIGGHVRLATPAGVHGDDRVAVRIRGGASRLTIGVIPALDASGRAA